MCEAFQNKKDKYETAKLRHGGKLKECHMPTCHVIVVFRVKYAVRDGKKQKAFVSLRARTNPKVCFPHVVKDGE